MGAAASVPDPSSTSAGFESSSRLPRVDAHVHVIDPTRFPYREGAGYHPGPDEVGPYDALIRTLDRHQVRRALLVQPSCYDTDNGALLDALRRDPARFRGIAAVPETPDDKLLTTLRDAGVVGVRFNFEHSSSERLRPAAVRRILAAIAPLGWFAEINAASDTWATVVADLADLADLGVPILVDHFGGVRANRPISQPGFQSVCALGRDSSAAIKLSAPYRLSSQPQPYVDLRPYVDAIFEAYGPGRIVWGSDWPFINTTTKVDYPNPANLLTAWGADDALVTDILATNPAGLFSFPDHFPDKQSLHLAP